MSEEWQQAMYREMAAACTVAWKHRKRLEDPWHKRTEQMARAAQQTAMVRCRGEKKVRPIVNDWTDACKKMVSGGYRDVSLGKYRSSPWNCVLENMARMSRRRFANAS